MDHRIEQAGPMQKAGLPTPVVLVMAALIVIQGAGHVQAADVRLPFLSRVQILDRAAKQVQVRAEAAVVGENEFRRSILADLKEMSWQTGLLVDAAASDDLKFAAFRVLARANDIAGRLAANLPRSEPFASLLPLQLGVQSALEGTNQAALTYFGGSAPPPAAFGLAREVAVRVAAMPDRIRQAMGHSDRRNNIVEAFQDFGGLTRQFAATMGDPLLTESGRHRRLQKLLDHAAQLDQTLLENHSSDTVRAAWNGIHETLNLLRSYLDA